ncbi:hypothetical protein SAMN05216387_101225 [Nitrosovibrio tenuis]|uniref:Uncharacterized protein n=1 Tax=Nitrosovibrio tenuis TaxID=1233 RepID=A0A1H7GCC9_9PROT|nr:hypothetical protein SAMN05216387_101225 [Nitrosovibrio tenuis]
MIYITLFCTATRIAVGTQITLQTPSTPGDGMAAVNRRIIQLRSLNNTENHLVAISNVCTIELYRTGITSRVIILQ